MRPPPDIPSWRFQNLHALESLLGLQEAREDSTYAVPRLLLGATGQWIAEFRGRFTSNAPVNGVTCIRRYDDFLLLI